MRLDEQAGILIVLPRRAAPEQEKNTRRTPQSREVHAKTTSSGNSAMSDANLRLARNVNSVNRHRNVPVVVPISINNAVINYPSQYIRHN